MGEETFRVGIPSYEALFEFRYLAEGKGGLVFMIHRDGRVELGRSIDLAGVKSMDMEYLKFVREVVNTAIYDKERGL
jgi:hypothetical protein